MECEKDLESRLRVEALEMVGNVVKVKVFMKRSIKDKDSGGYKTAQASRTGATFQALAYLGFEAFLSGIRFPTPLMRLEMATDLPRGTPLKPT